MDAAITYTGGFIETAANDGSVEGSVVMTLWGDTFTSGVVSGGLVGFTRVPAGLTAVLTRDSDTQLTLTLTGRASAHANADDVNDLALSFTRHAFSGGDNDAVAGSVKDAFATIDFRDPGVSPPGRVTTVRVAPGSGELTVSWDAVTGATGYKVQWKSGSQGYDAANRQATVTATSHTVPNLTAGTVYTVRVIATLAGEDDGPAMDGPASREATGTPNRAPVFTAGATATRSFAENTAAGTDIGAVLAATDADGHRLIWSLGGADAASFRIVSTSGQLQTRSGVTYDFETDSSYSVTVTVTDVYGGSDSIDVTIALTDVSEPPGAPAAPTIGTTTATSLVVNWLAPANTGPAITDYDVQYRQGTSGDWTDHEHTGTALTTTLTGLARNQSYQVQVRATNAEGTGGWSPSGTGTPTPDTTAPSLSAATVVGASLVLTYDEALDTGSVPGSRGAFIVRAGGTVRALAAGSWISIAGRAVTLTLASVVGAGETVTVTYVPSLASATPIRDLAGNAAGGLSNRAVTNATPALVLSASALTVTEGGSGSYTVRLAARPSASVTVAITSSNAEVTVDDTDTVTSGVQNTLTFTTGNWSTAQTVTVRAAEDDDAAGDTATLTHAIGGAGEYDRLADPRLAVTVNDNDAANAAPEFASDTAARSFAENTAAGTDIGDALTATDADNDTLTYSLSGTDAASFDIVSDSGQLRTKSGVTYDFETKSSYTVTVEVSDGTATDTVTVTVTLTDVDGEAPATPAAPTFGTATSTSLAVSWLKPDNSGPGIDDYDVQYREVTTPAPGWTDAGHTGAARTLTIASLETGTSYEVQVRATNDEGTSAWSASGTGTTGANVAPAFTFPAGQSGYRFDLAENADGGTTAVALGTVSATDTDSGQTVSYSIATGDTAGVFAIDSDGAITYTGGGENFEGFSDPANAFTLTVRATDSHASPASTDATVTVTVADVDEPPAAPAAPTFGATTASSIVVRWSEPANTGPAITDYDVRYRPGTSGDWTDHDHTGTATTATLTGLTTDASYQVQVRATNAEGTGAWSASGTGTATANHPPVFQNTPYTFTLAENADGSTTAIAIGTVSATDADAGDTVSYSITAGNTGNVFAIVASGAGAGAITYAGAGEDHETIASFSLTVRATDGTVNTDVTVTVNVTDVTETATLTIAGLADATVNEHAVFTSATPTVSGGAIGETTWTLEGADAEDFTIDGATGVVSMVGRDFEAPADADTNNVYAVTVKVTDADGNADTHDFTVTVTDANEAPVFDTTGLTLDASGTVLFSVAENTTAVGTVTAADPDAADTSITYGVASTDAVLFDISAAGVITFKSAPDFEDPMGGADDDSNEYTFDVFATAGSGTRQLGTGFQVKVTVTDVTETATLTIAGLADATVNENAAFTSATPTVSGGAIGETTWTLEGADAADFTIDRATGVVSMVGRDFEAPADADTNNVYAVTVKVTDADGNTDTHAFTVTVTDVDEGPVVREVTIASAGADDTFNLGEDIVATVVWTTELDVTGTPRLPLTIGSATRYADLSDSTFASGLPDTGQLKFTYTVQAGDNDADGISVPGPVDLNGGTITEHGGATDADLSLGSHAIANSGRYKVSTPKPELSVSAADTTVTEGEDITIAVTRDDTSGAASFSVNFAVTGGAEFGLAAAIARTAAFADGAATASVVLSTRNDRTDEPDGAVTVALVAGDGYDLPDAGSSVSVTVRDNDKAPGPPTITSVTPGDRYLVVVWMPPADPGYIDGTEARHSDTDIEGYRVRWRRKGTSGWWWLLRNLSGPTSAGPGAQAPFQITLAHEHTATGNEAHPRLAVGQEYEIQIQADAGYRVAAEWSAIASASTLAAGAPVVTGVGINDAGDDDTFHPGDTISITVEWNAELDVTGTPRLPIEIGRGTAALRFADYASGANGSVPAGIGGRGRLVFQYTVQAGDRDADGISLYYDVDLNGGSIRTHCAFGAGADCAANALFANLDLGTHKIIRDARYKVDGRDGTPPALGAARVSGAALSLVYDEALDPGSVPAAGAFAVTVAGAARAVSSVAVAGSTVTLTLASAVTDGEAVTVSYEVPATNPIRDASGNAAAAFGARTAAHDTGADTTAPALVSAALADATLVLTFDEALDERSVPAARAFAVSVGPHHVWRVDRVAVADATVTLTLRPSANPGNRGPVTVSYAAPAANPLRDLAGNAAGRFFERAVARDDTKRPGIVVTAPAPAPLPEGGSATYTVRLDAMPSGVVAVSLGSDNADVVVFPPLLTFAPVEGSGRWDVPQEVTVFAKQDADDAHETAAIAHRVEGHSAEEYRSVAEVTLAVTVTDDEAPVDTTAPVLSAAAADGAALTLTYDETLDAGSVPGPGAFAVTVAGAARAVSGVAVAGDAVRLTLASAVDAGETVTVGYAVPAANPIRDASGNAAAAFAGRAVTHGAAEARVAPAVVGLPAVTGPGDDGAYAAGDRIEARVRFTAPVTVDTSGGSPTLGLALGGVRREAAYESGSGTAELLFALSVPEAAAGAGAAKAIANGIRLGGATMRGADGTDAALAFGSAPGVTAVEIAAPDDGSWDAGDAVRVTVTFAEPVEADTSGGTPSVGLTLGDGAARTAAYAGGSGTDRLVFAYTLVADDGAVSAATVGPNTLALNGGGIRSTAGLAALLAHHGAALAAVAPAGEARLSVADASVQEAAGAVLSFRVTLAPAAEGPVTVDWATADGTATAGADYTAGSGTLAFAAGETAKTIEVAVLDDDVDEGSETLTLRLSNPSGAVLGDAEATGTIVNTDLMPRAWLARFGRTAADQVVEAVTARFEAPRQPGSEVSIGGHAMGESVSPEAREAWEACAARSAAFVDRGRLRSPEDGSGAGTGGPGDRCRSGTQGMTGRELLTGSSFRFAAGSAETGYGTVWGSAAATRFDGREGALSLDGEVLSATVGADFGRGRTTLGLALAHSAGEGSYRGAGEGRVSSTLTGLYPYGRYAVSDRLALWGLAGYGAGTLTLKPEGGGDVETDIDMTMAAAGVRAVLAEAPAEGGLELAAKSDGLLLRISSDAARDGDGGRLAASDADVTRLRLGLEGTWRGIETGGGGTLTPSLELGLRHDGGDAETGFGLEAGAGLAWSDPASGIEVDLRASGLLAHEDGGFRERGLSGSLAWDPRPDSDRGPSLTLTQTLGASASGGVDTLFRDGAPADLAANDNGLDARRFEATLGFGLGAFGDRFTATPEAGFGLANDGRDYRLGWRLARDRRAGDPGSLELRLDATRREAANDDAEPEHTVGFELRATW